MKKYLVLITIIGQLLTTLSADSTSWTGTYIKLYTGYSNLKLNYSGDKPYTMDINMERTPAYGRPSYRGYIAKYH